MILTLLLVVCLLAGCTTEAPPPPYVPPAPEDLSHWTLPELVATPIRELQAPPRQEPAPTAAEKVYEYAPGGTYAVPVSVGFPLDIVFCAEEQVTTLIDGDRAPQGEGQTRRWVVHQGVSGEGGALHHHVFVTVTEPGLRNGLTIATNMRTYYVTLTSVKQSPVRVLRWTYGQAPRDVAQKSAPMGPLPPLDTPALYHVGYEVTSSRSPVPTWMPRQIVDDGKKTYILFPEVTLFESVPLLRLIGPNGPQLVNARQHLNIVIVDQLIARAELRVGTGEHAEVVTITRGHLRTIRCPEDGPDCPTWPDAARVLARRPS